MDEATVALTVMTALIGMVFLGFLIWGIKTGQFHNVEEAKYQVLWDQKQSKTDQEESPDDPEKEVKSDDRRT
jgi:cbb3-type cytochrome oxidase maturation protein